MEIWKRFRKWGGIPSGLTQNVKDLLASREIENIFENSDFIYMLNQALGRPSDFGKAVGNLPAPAFVCDPFRSRRGAFVLWKCDHPFLVDHFPKDTLLYSVLTTRPDEVAGTKA